MAKKKKEQVVEIVDKQATNFQMPDRSVGAIMMPDRGSGGGEMPLNSPAYTGSDLEKEYAGIEDKTRTAIEEAYNITVNSLENQKADVGEQYDDVRQDVYKNARLSAIGNNEALAAMGLAGNINGQATSGYSETSRINDSANMRNNINAATLNETKATKEISDKIIEAGITKNKDIADALAKIGLEKLIAIEDQNRYIADYEKDVWKVEQDKIENDKDRAAAEEEQLRDIAAAEDMKEREIAAQEEQYARELAEQERIRALEAAEKAKDDAEKAKQQAIANAYKEVATFGYIKTKEAAAALGLKIGTPSWDVMKAK